MSLEKITPFYLFLNENMSNIREFGMTPNQTFEKAYELWKNMDILMKFQYIKKIHDSELRETEA
jgi:hypothetical protein